MGEETTSMGGIHISPNAVATIAYYATLQSYGVVGLAPKNLTDGIVSTITREPSRGVSVMYKGDDIDIDIHIIIEYGTRINSCLLYTSPSPRDRTRSRMPSSA